MDKEIPEILEKISVYQQNEQDEKMLSFYSALNLYSNYFWYCSSDNIYLRTRTANNIVLFGFRLLLASNKKLFPCHKSLFKVVNSLENKPANIIEKAEIFLKKMNNESKDDFVNSILNFCNYKAPEDYTVIQ